MFGLRFYENGIVGFVGSLGIFGGWCRYIGDFILPGLSICAIWPFFLIYLDFLLYSEKGTEIMDCKVFFFFLKFGKSNIDSMVWMILTSYSSSLILTLLICLCGKGFLKDKKVFGLFSFPSFFGDKNETERFSSSSWMKISPSMPYNCRFLSNFVRFHHV